MRNRCKYIVRNMKLSKKMMLVYIFLIGICAFIAITALQISLNIYDEKLYEKSLQELDFFTQKVNDDLKEAENLTYTIAMGTEIQQQLTKITSLNYLSADYSYEMYRLRMMFLNELYTHEMVKNICYTDGSYTKFTVGEAGMTLDAEDYENLLEDFHAAQGGYVVKPPTADYPYLLCGRDIRKHLDASLDYLGSIVFTCDVAGMIDHRVKDLEARHTALLVYSEYGDIYQSDQFDRTLIPDLKQDQGYRVIQRDGRRYFICYLKSSQNGWTFVNVFPYSEIFGKTMMVRYWMIGGFLALFLGSALVMKRMSYVITKPLEQLSQSMQIVETGDFDGAKVVLDREIRNDETGLLAQEFRVMLDKINLLIHENYEKQLVLQDTRYKMLQAQINPHFLYNTLNALNWMVRSKRNEDAGKMIIELGQLLRASFSKEPYSTVEADVELVRSYMTIQQFRYQRRADFQIEAAGELGSYLIPHMTLQPLVENAIYYGVENALTCCQVLVRVQELNDTILLEVLDSGPGMDAAQLLEVQNGTMKPKGNGIGLNNIRERLRMTYQDSEFTINSSPGIGTAIAIRIPKIRKGDLHVSTINCR